MPISRTRICFVALFMFLIHPPAIAFAEEHIVSQKGRAFSPAEITVRVGDTVYFANNDDVPHNVVSTSRGNTFDLGQQAPGVATPVTFTLPGEVRVECLMHPRMKMTIKVRR